MICRQPSTKARRGYALLEVSISALLVGLLLVAALRSAGAAISGQFKNAQQARAQHLAQELMTEVLQKGYRERGGPVVFGPETGEVSGTSRLLFDDVDDYHSLNDAPPAIQDGTPIANGAGWQRTVTVAHVEPDDLTLTAGSDKGVKRVRVTVSFSGRAMATMTAVVTQARQNVPTY